MRKMIVFISASLLVMSCSTANKSGQTPDDVYFSPARNNSGYVMVEENEEYRSENVPMGDRYLRMKTMGGSRWRMFDEDYTYWNNPHWNNRSYFDIYPSFGSMGFNRPIWGSPFFGGYTGFYNPFSPVYYGQPVVVFNNVKPTPRSTGPRTINLNSYTPPKNTYTNPKLGIGNFRFDAPNNGGGSTPRGGYNPRGNGESYGSPTRTFSSGSSNSGSSNSSGSGGSSGSAPVRTFPKGGN